MKRKFRKFLSAALACTIIISSTLTAPMTASADTTTAVTESTETKTYTITKKKLPTYVFDTGKDHKFKTPLYFVNGSDVPYMKLENWIALYKKCAEIGYSNTDFDVTVQKDKDDDNVVYLIRENSYYMGMDFANDKLGFWDYNAFVDLAGNGLMSFTGGLDIGDKDSPKYLKELSTSNQRYGDMIKMDLGDYGIDLVRKGSNYYIPLQTLSDVFLAPTAMNILYNGNAVIITGGGSACLADANGMTDLGKIYYKDGGSGKISKAMAEFSYNEFCFALDHLYGLKEQHNIKDFRTLMKQVGYEQYFLSTNQTRTEKRLYDLIENCLDDQHSGLLLPSYAADLKSVGEYMAKKGNGHSVAAALELQSEFSAARAKYYPDGVPAYQEIGDTAFITFDIFDAFDYGVDYYETAPTAEATDTIGIIAYSVQQILRENSPVKNVVLDLSCNGGGVVFTAIYVVAAFLGKASVCTEDPNTGALVTRDYKVDTNFDGKFDSKDTLAGKGLNLYCLESSLSFSSGNFVPCAFKDSGKVTLLGQTSGGGTCSVMYLSTASGSLIQMSSSQRLSFMKNGSFYDIDRGAAPDVAITKIEHYYDRKALAEFINGLF